MPYPCGVKYRIDECCLVRKVWYVILKDTIYKRCRVAYIDKEEGGGVPSLRLSRLLVACLTHKTTITI